MDTVYRLKTGCPFHGVLYPVVLLFKELPFNAFISQKTRAEINSGIHE